MYCPRCGLERPIVCASCGSDTLRQFRVGVTRAREQLEALAGRPVGEVVAGTRQLPEARVPGRYPGRALYRDGEFAQRRAGSRAVAFVDFDQELLAPRYRAGEEALALLSRASRIVGGRRQGGRVLVQTRVPAHPVVEAALLADPGRLLMSEEPVRKALRLPPFAALALVSGPGAARNGRRAGEARGGRRPPGRLWRTYCQWMAWCARVRLRRAGPAGLATAAPIELSQLAEDRWVVRAPDHSSLADALGAAGRPAARVRVEVGPVRW